jgi:acetylornithine deacetylase
MNSLEWLSRLIAFDTTSRNSNLGCIDVIKDWCEKHRLIARLSYNPTKEKANIFATLPASNGSVNGGLILSGHTDTVPVDGQKWDTDPFKAVQIRDSIFGRGACDMKGFIAVALSLIPDFQRLKLKRPLHFAFSYDEEVGANGAHVLIADLEKSGIKPESCIIGEPTDMRPVVAHKGFNVFRCRVHGHAAHSSLTPQGCNAIDYSARLISYIRSMAERIKLEGPFDKDFDVPYTTISTNMIQGGIALNTIPALCEFFFDLRQLPHVQVQGIIGKLEMYMHKELHPHMQLEKFPGSLELTNTISVPSFTSSEESAINKLTRALTGDKKIHKVTYGTEAGIFEEAEIDTILCGPGSIANAHAANEFVTIDQLTKCEGFLRKAVEGYCA